MDVSSFPDAAVSHKLPEPSIMFPNRPEGVVQHLEQAQVS